MKQCSKCKEFKDKSAFGKNRDGKDQLMSVCKVCRNNKGKQYRLDNIDKERLRGKKYRESHKEERRLYYKQYCIDNSEILKLKAQEYRNEHKVQTKLRGLKYRQNNKEELRIKRALYRIEHPDYDANYYQTNKERLLEQKRAYAREHVEELKAYRRTRKSKIKELNFNANSSPVKYELYKDKLTIEEEPILAEDGITLEVRCKYCGKYFKPLLIAVRARLQALHGVLSGDLFLYCSEECKRLCPTYNQHKYPKGFKHVSSREVDPLVRKLCFETDEWECQRCGSTESLICHHILGYAQYKTLGNDLANVITFCEDCHKFIHSFPGCRYVDLRCDLKEEE